MSHTPGPYILDRDGNECIVIMKPEGGMSLATIMLSEGTGCGNDEDISDEDFDAEMLANAHMFKAAPDMLAALEAATSLRHAAQQFSDGNPNFPWIVVRDSHSEWCDLHDAAIKSAKGEQP